MIRYGKTTEKAISSMSYLAEVYGDGQGRASSIDIARKRNLPQTLVAKLLTQLSQAGLVVSRPGPGGGYSLARPPVDISFLDVANVFERTRDTVQCPFGPGWCGNHEPCPMHDRLVEMDEQFTSFLCGSTFDVFVC